jgi:hypothetical protein
MDWYVIDKDIRSRLKSIKSRIEFKHHSKLIRLEASTPTTKLKNRYYPLSDEMPNTTETRIDQTETQEPVFNFSKRVLTNNEKKVLSKGLSFGIKDKNLNSFDILSNFEIANLAIESLNLKINEEPNTTIMNSKTEFKSKLQNIALDFVEMSKQSNNSLTKQELDYLKTISQDKTIVVTKADKGNSVVIMDRQEYVAKLKALINNEKFQKINEDPTLKREKNLQSSLNYLRKTGAITDEVYKLIRPVGSKPGILYGLPKVHKPNAPIRPIISSIGAYNYKLAKYLDSILQPLLKKNEYLLKDTFDFVNKVSGLCHDKEFLDFLASFDVESLFTNVPLNETIEIILNDIYTTKNDRFHGLSRRQLKRLLEIATQKSHFLFDGEYYDQVDGVAMGSPLGPTLANIFMSHFEKKHMANMKKLGLKVWMRYVDDTFVVLRNKEDSKKLLRYLNDQHPNIKFTHEEQENNTLPFLDVLVTIHNKKLISRVYRKKTFTGVYLNWNSLTSKRYKIGLINCLLDRTWNICSSTILFHDEMEKLKSILLKNDYPIEIIDRAIEKFLNRKMGQSNKKTNVPKPKVTLTLPYLDDQKTEIFETKLNGLIKSYYPQLDLKVAYKTPKQIKDLFRYKDQIPKDSKSFVIYKLNCLDCDACYIGKTIRQLKTRVEEHQKGIGSRECEISAVYKHAQETRHKIDFDNVEVLDSAGSDYRLKLKEALYIKKFNPQLNVQVQSDLFRLITIGN